MSSNNIGRYQIKKELGRGGFATVFLCTDPSIDRNVAVKVLPREFLHDPNFKKRFIREAKTIAALEHPHIVPIYDFGEHEEQLFIVMRYMSGGSLANVLDKGPLPLEDSIRIMNRIGPALNECHQQGIIHRDLKPANILFDQRDQPYLADFGIAKLTEASAAFTGSGVIGTPAYMSPEQAKGEKDIDGRSDVYSLAVVLFEMLTGKQPYEADTPMGQAMKHIIEPVPDILEYNEKLPLYMEEIIAKAMAKEPEKRYQTTEEFSRVLNDSGTKFNDKGIPKKSPKAVETSQSHTKSATKKAKPITWTRIKDLITSSYKKLQPSPKENFEKKPLPWNWGIGGFIVIGLAYAIFSYGGFPNTNSVPPTLTLSLENNSSSELTTRTVTPSPPPNFTATLTETPTAPLTLMPKINAIDGAEMVYVPEGEFSMGSKNGEVNQRPVHIVYLDAYWIYKHEVTNAEYQLCEEAGACSKPGGTRYGNINFKDHPVVWVNWYNARDYCTWSGGRLPTEAEWEKAARGTDGRTYPWLGTQISSIRANYGENVGNTTEVGSYPDGASPYGVLDMAGNVREWVSDWYKSDYYQESPLENPTGPDSGENRVIRGGSWGDYDAIVLSTYRHNAYQYDSSQETGFRCVANP